MFYSIGIHANGNNIDFAEEIKQNDEQFIDIPTKKEVAAMLAAITSGYITTQLWQHFKSSHDNTLPTRQSYFEITSASDLVARFFIPGGMLYIFFLFYRLNKRIKRLFDKLALVQGDLVTAQKRGEDIEKLFELVKMLFQNFIATDEETRNLLLQQGEKILASRHIGQEEE